MIPLTRRHGYRDEYFRAFIWSISSRLHAEMKLPQFSSIIIPYAKLLHFSQATQIFSDFSVFLRLFTRKSIALGAYLILVYKTNIKCACSKQT
jgi:hypothetical protein